MDKFETAVDLMEQDRNLTPTEATALLANRRATGESKGSALNNPAVNPGMAKLQAEQQASTPTVPQSPAKSR